MDYLVSGLCLNHGDLLRSGSGGGSVVSQVMDSQARMVGGLSLLQELFFHTGLSQGLPQLRVDALPAESEEAPRPGWWPISFLRIFPTPESEPGSHCIAAVYQLSFCSNSHDWQVKIAL